MPQDVAWPVISVLPSSCRAYNIVFANGAPVLPGAWGPKERGGSSACMYFVYSVFTAVGVLLLSPYLLLRGLGRRQYLKNLPERMGMRFPPELRGAGSAGPGAIWVHAVSVGEVLAALPLARSLKQRFGERRLVISTTTATGQALARERMKFADAVFYFPLDWRGPVRRALAAVHPAVVVVFETEIWPNFLRETRRTGTPVVFVNGRISDRSFRRFSRALRWFGGVLRGFLRGALADGTLYLMQSEEDAKRVLALGAPAGRVVVSGNLKYDLARAEESDLGIWLQAEMARSGRGPLLVAGSVVAGEENAVLGALDAVEGKWPGALLILAPRKPDRFDAAAGLVEQSGRVAVRRSGVSLDGASAGVLACAAGSPRRVLLLDTIGELAAIYGLADGVFIGGSLEPAGGHNPLEPAVAGRAPVFGPSMDNFRDVAREFVRADAAIVVRSGAELGAAWIALLDDAERSSRMGQAAQELVERHRGATAATLERLAAVLAEPQAARL
jgi:3-deoxy-D-manno-octulosonic-acid transferase